LISIIIPTWNREKYIEECIESCLAQTYTDYEIIVVDDGSTDSTVDIVKKYPIINLIETEHFNAAHAINIGIQESWGDWIKLLGSDDYLLPNCLNNFIKNVDNEECIYYSDYYVLKDGLKYGFICPEYPKEQQYTELRNKFYGGCSFLSDKLFQKYGVFDESLPYAEDYEYWLRLVSNGVEMKHLPFYSTVFRIHDGQNTKKYGKLLDEGIRNKYTVS